MNTRKVRQWPYKVKPKVRVSLYKNYRFLWIPEIRKNKLLWKDKFQTPRCEAEPQFGLEWLRFGLFISIGDDHYWEQWLWIYKYNDGDVKKAEETWGWTDCHTGKSTWNYGKPTGKTT